MKKIISCKQNKQPIRNKCLIMVAISVLGFLLLVVSRRHLENSMFLYFGKNKRHSASEFLKHDSEIGISSLGGQRNILHAITKGIQPMTDHFTNITNTEVVTRQYTSRDTVTNNAGGFVRQYRSDNCNKCFQNNFDLLLDNRAICKLYKEQGNIDLIIMITSSPDKENSRNTIRSTWASVSKNNTSNVRHVFLFGNSGKSDSNSRLSEEHAKHGDIIQGDFLDSYYNLTYKTMMGLKWINENCYMAKYVLKTDDDMWVNVPALLLQAKNNHKFLQTGIAGFVHTKEEPVRNPDSKWYASLSSYPHAYYPPFCSGTGYLFSMHTARSINVVSHNTPFFHLEDIYIALCVYKLGYQATSIPGFHSWNLAEPEPCFYKSSHVITVHGIDFDFMKEIWNTVCYAKE